MRLALRRSPLLLAAMLMVFAANSLAQAQSLWALGSENGRARSLFADRVARREGDVLTILIVERSQATQTADTRTSKSGEVGLGPGGGLLAQILPLIQGSGSERFEGAGRTTRGGTVQAQMTATVIEVLPNGNLLVEGRQQVTVNGEHQEIVITGVVRPEDVAPDNTVLSTYVADARIEFQGEGALGTKQEPGILTRIFNWLF